jgi:DNA-binding transcriptional regulator LsrR (DeoR family)
MGRRGKPETTKLRNRVVMLWNKGNTQTEIGAALGLTRGVVGRLIAEARAKGVVTVRYTPLETAKRTHAAIILERGEQGYRDLFAAAGHKGQAALLEKLGEEGNRFRLEELARLGQAARRALKANKAAGIKNFNVYLERFEHKS